MDAEARGGLTMAVREVTPARPPIHGAVGWGAVAPGQQEEREGGVSWLEVLPALALVILMVSALVVDKSNLVAFLVKLLVGVWMLTLMFLVFRGPGRPRLVARQESQASLQPVGEAGAVALPPGDHSQREREIFEEFVVHLRKDLQVAQRAGDVRSAYHARPPPERSLPAVAPNRHLPPLATRHLG